MPKLPYTNNVLSQYSNPLPFPNYLNSLSLLTDSSTSSVRKFFNANKSISEALLITLISMIQEGIAYQLANHSNINVDNNSKSYTNNTNFYCYKGVPIRSNLDISTSSAIKKRSSSFSYSKIRRNSISDEPRIIIKDNEGNIVKSDNSNGNTTKTKNRLSRSFSSSSLECSSLGKSSSQYTNTLGNLKIKNSKVNNGSQLKYSIKNEDLSDISECSSIEFSYIDVNSKKNNEKQFLPPKSVQNESKIDHDSIKNTNTKSTGSNKMSIFILLKNLMNMLDLFKSFSSKKQKQTKPFNSFETLDDKEKWEEFNRIYNEAMYNLKTEEYYKNKSLIFKYSTGLNSAQGCYFDLDDNTDDMENSAISSMSILDEKIRENSENQKTDIFSRIKKDTLTRAEIKECGEYMRRVGIYQIFIQCPINHFLRVIASKLFSCGEKKYSPILRFLFVTCVISPIQISVNILCLALSNKKTPSEIKKCFADNFMHILKLSLLYVPFSSQYLARTFLPRHLWVPFFNICSFLLGTYIKLLMKKKDDRKLVLL